MEVDDADMAIRDARTVFHGRCPDSITDDDFYRHYAPLGPVRTAHTRHRRANELVDLRGDARRDALRARP